MKRAETALGSKLAAGVGFFILGTAALALLLSRFGVAPRDSIKFVLGLAVCFYIPGRSLLALVRAGASPLETTTLALSLGMTAGTLVYRLAAAIGLPWLFWGWVAAGLAGWAVLTVREKPWKKRASLRSTRTAVGLAAVGAAVLFLLVVDNYRNGVELADGSLRLHMHYYDGFTRNNLVRELSHSVPPQMSFAAGLPLSYHYDMNLFASFFYKYLGIGVLDLLHRLTITFYFALLILSAFIFIRGWSGSAGAALLGAALVLFGSGGLSYAFTLLAGGRALWGQAFFSFYYLDLTSINPILPGLAVLLSGLFCLEAYFRLRKRVWLWLAAFFLAMITGYKMTLALPLLAALAAAALLALVRRRDASLLVSFLATALLTAPFLAAAHLLNKGGMSVQAKFHFTDWISYALLDTKIWPLVGAWGDFLRFLRPAPEKIPLILAALLVFLLGAFGLSLSALPSLAKQTWAVRKNGLMNVLLGFLFLAGAGFFFFTTPALGGHARNWLIVDAFKVSAFVLLLYAARWLVHALRGARPALKASAAAAFLLLSIPNTADFVRLKRAVPETMIVEQPFLETCRFLTGRTESDSVVLHSRHVRYVCYFADRRVVLDDSPHSYLDYHLEPLRLQERRSDIEAFFADPAVNSDVLHKYGVTHVLVKRRADTSIWGETLAERLEFAAGPRPDSRSGRVVLELVFRNSRYALLKVSFSCTR